MGSVNTPPPPPPHFIIFPFMAYGHTIPLLYLGRLLRHRGIAVTIITTPLNSPWIRTYLHNTDISILEIPFPENIHGIPPGVENTEKLPSISSFIQLANATKLMQTNLEIFLQEHHPISCLISDTFLGWTQKSAEKHGIPRLVFSGMGSFAMTMYQILGRERPHVETTSLDQPFLIKSFPRWNLTRNDFDPPFCDLEPKGPYVDFMMEQTIGMAQSHGLIVNSFDEIDSKYTDYWNDNIGPKAWCIGPLCLAKPKDSLPTFGNSNSNYMKWLDEKFEKGEKVLYVAFGTQAQVDDEQLEEIAKGLEDSKVNFLWVLRSKNMEILRGFEERVNGRGLILREWVDQMEILRHESVKGFLSHCGWNSVLESICAKVAILAMPFMAEQHLNARFIVEEIGVGLRIMPRDGAFRGPVGAEEEVKRVKELMEGEKGEEVRKKMEMVGEAACDAMKNESGSSWKELDMLIEDVCRKSTLELL